jgi:hypothetical protein
VSVKDYTSEPGEVRFDMFRGEFTHVGDKCSFEILLERLGLNDPALRAIAEIVHDIDLKDAKFGRCSAYEGTASTPDSSSLLVALAAAWAGVGIV